MEPSVQYLLHLADCPLILGQRLGEWCGHGPVLEQDIAMTNISLDLIGQSRLLYQHIASLPGQNTDEDTLAMLRYEHEYYNLLLVEQPNKNFGHTIVRQFFYDAFNLLQYEALTYHHDEILKSIAIKTLKEIKYHYRYSSEWMMRLGDGTQVSHQYVQEAVDELWKYTGELFQPSSYEKVLLADHTALDLSKLKPGWDEKINTIFQEAGLNIPQEEVFLTGGKEGRHTEHLGYILTELQYMQRTYPSMKW
jgi:ring-1,2-phenylacetyl-CoA epoxidase subunit PaaC